LFKHIIIATTEYTGGGGGNTGKIFHIKCRYLKTDDRINKKVIKIRRNSHVLITGELVLINNSEFQVDIQDFNFLPMSIANMEMSTTTSGSSSSSLYSWSNITSSGRISAQDMANTHISENRTPAMNTQTPTPNITNDEIQTTKTNTPQESNISNENNEDNEDNEDTAITSPNDDTPLKVNVKRTYQRKKKKK
jgi:hypothetical protein